MKKVVAVLLALGLILMLSGCEPRDRSDTSAEETLESAMFDGTYSTSATGKNGEMDMEVTISAGKIIEIKVLAHQEHPIIGAGAIETYADRIIEAGVPNVDIVAGATETCLAISEGVTKVMQQAGASQELLMTRSEYPKLGESKSYSHDVIVVGSGCAGLMAAISAAENGADVAVVEKNNYAGGTALISDGVIATTIDRTADSFYNDILENGDSQSIATLVSLLSENTADVVDSLKNKLDFSPVSDGNKGVSQVDSIALIEYLLAEAKSKGVTFYFGATAVEITQAEGRVNGVIAESRSDKLTFSGGSVVLATGGYVSNPSLISTLSPDVAAIYNSSSYAYATGDGILLTEWLDPQLVNTDYYQLSPFFAPNMEIVSPLAKPALAVGVIVNRDGKIIEGDFSDESAFSQTVSQQPFSTAYIIWAGGSLDMGTDLSKSLEMLEHSSDIYSATTLKEAAEGFGIDWRNLESNIGGKLANGNRYYVHQISPALLYSLGGLKINSSAQVLNSENKPILGLYAAGDLVGGIHGARALDGSTLTSALVFGSIAGEKAAS